MDSTLLAAIIGGVSLVLATSITAGGAAFRDRLNREKSHSDRLLDDLESSNDHLERLADIQEKQDAKLAELAEIGRRNNDAINHNTSTLAILLDRQERKA